MKKTLLFIMVVTLFFAFSCKNNNSKKNNKDNDSTEVVNSDSDNANSNQNVSYDFKELGFSESEIPDDLYVGEITEGKKWQDEAGINYLVISEKTTRREASDGGSEFKSYEIHGYHYVEKDDDFELIREIKDFKYDCDLILDCGLSENSLEVTDLDNDNYGEATFMYYLYCAMDLSPSTMKLMLLENGDKYPIRGESYANYGPEGIGGDMNLGHEFNNAPSEFKNFAIKKWKTIVYEKSGIIPEYKLIEQFEDVTFSGVEPNWTVKFGVYGITFSEMGQDDIYLKYTSIDETVNGRKNIMAKVGNSSWEFYVQKEPCNDGMSNNEYTHSIRILTGDGRDLRGCCCKK